MLPVHFDYKYRFVEHEHALPFIMAHPYLGHFRKEIQP